MYDRAEFFISQDGVNWESRAQFYQSMDTTGSAAPSWKRYEFSVPNVYGGGEIFLRFRAYVPFSQTVFYCGGSNDLSGFYIDDVAITYYDVSSNRKIFTLEGWEYSSPYASCPWVAPWNGTDYEADNDIYSVARYPENEYMDSYKLMKPLVEVDGVYPMEIQELQEEDSFTDFVALQQIDHEPNVAVAPDDKGKIVGYKPYALISPANAVDDKGTDILAQISSVDDQAFPAYSGDTALVEFENVDLSAGARLLLRVKGFLTGKSDYMPYVGPPAIVVETLYKNGQWQERGRLRPRFNYSEAAFDLSPFLYGADSCTVRLRSISHATKYHDIDFVALDAGKMPEFLVNTVSPSSATSAGDDILPLLSFEDGDYFSMTINEKFSLEFPAVQMAQGLKRTFILRAKGY
jgi:hypothetical protein